MYLYGITRERPAGLRLGEAVDGASQVETLAVGDWLAWISRVDAVEFGEELQQRMENLDWLAATTVRHQRVVDAIHHAVEILPARFATLFRSEASLAKHVGEQQRALEESFANVAGADEYAVKIFAVADAAPVAPAASGADYLKRKAEALKTRRPRAVTPELEKFIAALQRLARDSAEGGRVGSGQRNLLWHRSLLVARDKRTKLEKALAAFSAKPEYRIECTGPWPPYSFLKIAD